MKTCEMKISNLRAIRKNLGHGMRRWPDQQVECCFQELFEQVSRMVRFLVYMSLSSVEKINWTKRHCRGL